MQQVKLRLFVHIWSVLMICSYGQTAKLGKKILVMPADHNSGILQMVYLANGLYEDGHQVVFLAASKTSKVMEGLNSNISSVHEDKTGLDPNSKLSSVLDEALGAKTSFPDLMKKAFAGIDAMEKLAESFLSDPEAVKEIQSCDLAVVLAPEFYWTALIIPYKFDIPYIVVTPRTDSWAHGVVISPAVEPNFGFSSVDENSGFTERAVNFFSVVVFNTLASWFIDFQYNNMVSRLAPEKPFVPLSGLYRNAEMILVQQNPVCLDYPRNTMPHYQMVGGFSARKTASTKSAKMKEFEDFIGNSDFVMLTFGSQVKQIPENMLEVLVKTFQKFPHVKFVVRNKVSVNNCPKNILFSPWLPQSDLMAHPNLKLFITHGGLNGQNEGAYSGVPMLVLAIYGDHIYNARRAQRLGTAELLEFFDVTEERLFEKLTLMLNNPSYMEKAKKCKEVLQSLPSGVELSVFWVNHVLRFGSDHLKPLSKDMPWYKLLMLDVFFAILLVAYVSLKVVVFVAKLTVMKCCRKKKEKTN